MKAAAIFKAFAAIEAVLHHGSQEPLGYALWDQCLRAKSDLHYEILMAGLTVPIERDEAKPEPPVSNTSGSVPEFLAGAI